MGMLKLIKEIRSKTGELHFKRWRVLSTPWFEVYIHYIAKSDEDKHLHDHPWNFGSLILWGGYKEKTVKNGNTEWRTRLAGSFSYKKATDCHHINLIRPTWTLVFAGQRYKEWGYSTEHGWMSNVEYRLFKSLGYDYDKLIHFYEDIQFNLMKSLSSGLYKEE
jgi:hypothetical protein